MKDKTIYISHTLINHFHEKKEERHKENGKKIKTNGYIKNSFIITYFVANLIKRFNNNDLNNKFTFFYINELKKALHFYSDKTINKQLESLKIGKYIEQIDNNRYKIVKTVKDISEYSNDLIRLTYDDVLKYKQDILLWLKWVAFKKVNNHNEYITLETLKKTLHISKYDLKMMNHYWNFKILHDTIRMNENAKHEANVKLQDDSFNFTNVLHYNLPCRYDLYDLNPKHEGKTKFSNFYIQKLQSKLFLSKNNDDNNNGGFSNNLEVKSHKKSSGNPEHLFNKSIIACQIFYNKTIIRKLEDVFSSYLPSLIKRHLSCLHSTRPYAYLT